MTCFVVVDIYFVWFGVSVSSVLCEYFVVWVGRNFVFVLRGWDWRWGRGLGLCYLLIVKMLESDVDGRVFRVIFLVFTNAIILLISLVRIFFIFSSFLRLSGLEILFNSKF